VKLSNSEHLKYFYPEFRTTSPSCRSIMLLQNYVRSAPSRSWRLTRF